ncbi:MAG: glycine betaine ABC transporter substrate-binding protein [Rhodospirillales bacterium]|nr:glycine betaine ABC transporter substrate-binding protein [Rhodospirillales bacterium]
MRKTLLAVAALLTMLAAIPAGAAEPPALGKKKIIWTHGPWASGLVVTYMGKFLLEKAGYEVEMKLLDTGLAYQAIGTGQAEIWSSAYLPGQDSYLNKHGDNLDILSVSYGPVPGGLAVPGYVAVNSIEELKKPDVRKMFGGKIIGIDAGSGVMAQAKKAIEQYGLDFELVASSGTAKDAAFKAAYDKKEPIIITSWCPHYLCALYSVKFLSDNKGIYKDSQDYHIVRKGFRTDFPRATTLLARYTLTSEKVSQMLVWMENDKISAEQAAKRLMDQQPELVWYLLNDLGAGLTQPSNLK